MAPSSVAVANKPVTYEWRSAAWMLAHINKIAALNTEAFRREPWNERWDMDPEGTNPRTNSYAMVRDFASGRDGELHVISAEIESDGKRRIAGFGLGMQLNDEGIPSYHVESFGGIPGDYYLALVIVDPDFRESGIFSKLADLRCQRGHEVAKKHIWMQTHAQHQVVQRKYRESGFEVAGSLIVPSVQKEGVLVPSERVMMRKNVRT